MATIRDLIGDTLSSKAGSVSADALSGKTVGIYFSAHWCPPCRGFTPKLAEAYQKLKANGKELEIVFVSSDRDQHSFDEYFAEMPWLALPYEDRARKEALSKRFKVSGIPSLVFVTDTGELITTDGRSAIMDDPEGAEFPWTPKTFAESLGTSFIGQGGETVSEEAIRGKTLGIYFSAHWCPPCRGFTPKLVETYKKVKAAGRDFEVIFVSSDRDQHSFDEYFAEMPWLAVPHGDSRKGALSKLFEVEGIPTLVIVGADGKVINTEGTSAVGSDPDGAEYPWKPKPVNDLNEDAGKLNDEPCLCVLMDGSEGESELQAAWHAAVHEVAAEHASAAESSGTPPPVYFYTAKEEGPISDQVRKLTNVGRPKAEPVMLLLDIPDSGGFYVAESAEISAQTVREFVAAYQARTLRRQQLSKG